MDITDLITSDRIVCDSEVASKKRVIEIMSELKLAYPKQIDRAVPANQRCGLLTEL